MTSLELLGRPAIGLFLTETDLASRRRKLPFVAERPHQARCGLLWAQNRRESPYGPTGADTKP